MNGDSPQTDLLDELADEFVSRIQAGESPTINEYCQKHPNLEEPIRELFPTLAMLEDIKPSQEMPGPGQGPPPDRYWRVSHCR